VSGKPLVLELELGERVWISLADLEKHLDSESCDEVLEQIRADLTFPNPVYQQALRFSKNHRYIRAPKTLTHYKIRKPKTKPRIECPIGYLEPLVGRLRKHGILVKAVNNLCDNPVSFSSNISLYPYQKQGIEKCLKRHRGILVAPCGAGKTVIALEITALRQQKTLVLVHTLDLMKQWKSQAEEWLGLNASLVGQGHRCLESPLVIATVQTLIRNKGLMAELNDQIGTLIIDECHHTPATTFHKIVGQLRPTYLYGFSATPMREDGLTPIMHLFLGPTLHRILPEDLQKDSQLLKPRLELIETEFRFAYDRDDPESYGQLIDKLIHDKDRNQLIITELNHHSRDKNLILTQRIAHCHILEEGLKKLNPQASTAVITGSTPHSERELILERARAGDLAFLFATQLADEGLDIRCLEKLWMVLPGRSTARIEQRVGRIMRQLDGKKEPVVFDFVDSQTGVLFSQFQSRLSKVYQRLLKIP
jgi:superfamily II DNA or RNA helicase